MRQTRDRAATLLVDARRIQGQRSGVGRYALELLRALPTVPAAADLRVVALVDRTLPVPPLSGIEIVSLPGGVRWHIAAVRQVLRSRARYFSPESLVVPLLVARRASLVVHDLTPLTMPGRHTRRNVIFHRLFLRAALRRVRCVFVPTQAVARDLARLLPSVAEKVQVTGEGIATSVAPSREATGRGHSSVNQEPLRFLYVGNIEPRKNVIPLLRAFLAVAQPEWELSIVGRMGWLDAQAVQEFERLVATHANIGWLGYVSDERLAGLYAGADIFVYPTSAEGFGLPVAEALAHGLAVVTTADDAIREVAGDAAIYVPVDFAEEVLSDALRAVARDAGLRDELRERARARVASLSWVHVAHLVASAAEDVATGVR